LIGDFLNNSGAIVDVRTLESSKFKENIAVNSRKKKTKTFKLSQTASTT